MAFGGGLVVGRPRRPKATCDDKPYQIIAGPYSVWRSCIPRNNCQGLHEASCA
ncbi:hypothetical protein GOA97_19995 [Sinorhizobium meliloti]|nr:hypothetical protein [Sinorhizobium meliloti]MDW9656736.1 hypothetical protein [Sinorhizobium meliloti]MDW9916618.1 hypothetical protein [Sinorhizobium meliloti]MDW9943375.1 hypothetical protein [Sinorhizobium meliloti]MDW9947692.1 hypothetical protein [Sinorhizobium meliloti]